MSLFPGIVTSVKVASHESMKVNHNRIREAKHESMAESVGPTVVTRPLEFSVTSVIASSVIG